ncbi:efflux RND transporter periplasmic adaptor subunit [Algihabitans albus]|uniref:efflux RND transporter periplasmic adaptor subunit n=1 Tax=Algihabitans albus TaxID=2164067 RepID=UPI000E5CA5B6|nr:efflux RND transporter periplasmic adaptor subunit [Algihabitans albus]
MRLNRSYLIAALLAVGVTAWIASGSLGEDRREPQITKPPVDLDALRETTRVRVATSVATPRLIELSLTGHTEAVRAVDVKAETFGQIEELLVEKGERVAVGQLIARIDARDRQARLREAQALLRQRQIEFEAARKLNERGFRAETQLAESRATLDAAEATVEAAEVALEDLQIVAPFEGVLDDRMMDLGDYVETGDSIARVVDLDPVLVIAPANERDVRHLRVGEPGSAMLATGEEIWGRIRFVASEANSQTRTFRVELEVDNPDGQVPAGMTAIMHLPVDRIMAHQITPAILTLDDDGVLGLRTVQDNEDGEPETGVVRFVPISIVEDTSEGLFVTGLPEEVTLITVGQEFVKDGELVIGMPDPEFDRSANPLTAERPAGADR